MSEPLLSLWILCWLENVNVFWLAEFFLELLNPNSLCNFTLCEWSYEGLLPVLFLVLIQNPWCFLCNIQHIQFFCTSDLKLLDWHDWTNCVVNLDLLYVGKVPSNHVFLISDDSHDKQQWISRYLNYNFGLYHRILSDLLYVFFYT